MTTFSTTLPVHSWCIFKRPTVQYRLFFNLLNTYICFYDSTFEEQLQWPDQCSVSTVCLVILNLQSKSGSSSQEKNLYWLSNPKTNGQNFSALGDVRNNARAKGKGGPTLIASVSCGRSVGDELVFNVVVKNTEIVDSLNYNVALFTYLTVRFDPKDPTEDEDRILPVWYRDNYVTLLPREIWSTYFSIRRQSLGSVEGLPYVLVKGWNVFHQNLKFDLVSCA